METTPSVAIPLLQLGLLMGIVLVGNAIAVRHLPTESVPGILRPRVADVQPDASLAEHRRGRDDRCRHLPPAAGVTRDTSRFS